MKILTILSTIFLVASCAFHTGTLTSTVTNEPVVHKDVAVGVAYTNRIFNIGGLSKDALISDARKNMVRKRPLVGAEQYNNIEVNIKNTFYIVGHKTKVTITADVIEPKDSVDQPTYSENYLMKINKPNPAAVLFAIGDSVIFYNYNAQVAQIESFNPTDSEKHLVIRFLNSDNEFESKVVSINHLFLITPKYFGLKLGERLGDGVIIGFGLDKILIKEWFGNTTVAYPE